MEASVQTDRLTDRHEFYSKILAQRRICFRTHSSSNALQLWVPTPILLLFSLCLTKLCHSVVFPCPQECGAFKMLCIQPFSVTGGPLSPYGCFFLAHSLPGPSVTSVSIPDPSCSLPAGEMSLLRHNFSHEVLGLKSTSSCEYFNMLN